MGSAFFWEFRQPRLVATTDLRCVKSRKNADPVRIFYCMRAAWTYALGRRTPSAQVTFWEPLLGDIRFFRTLRYARNNRSYDAAVRLTYRHDVRSRHRCKWIIAASYCHRLSEHAGWAGLIIERVYILMRRTAGQVAVQKCHTTCTVERHYTGNSGVSRNFVRGGGGNKFSWGQREWGSGGGSPLVRGSGGNCNLVQQISFHIVKFS